MTFKGTRPVYSFYLTHTQKNDPESDTAAISTVNKILDISYIWSLFMNFKPEN